MTSLMKVSVNTGKRNSMKNLRAEVLAADSLQFVDISMSKIQDGGSKDGKLEAAMP